MRNRNVCMFAVIITFDLITPTPIFLFVARASWILFARFDQIRKPFAYHLFPNGSRHLDSRTNTFWFPPLPLLFFLFLFWIVIIPDFIYSFFFCWLSHRQIWIDCRANNVPAECLSSVIQMLPKKECHRNIHVKLPIGSDPFRVVWNFRVYLLTWPVHY